jgi:hypothetical protein
MLIDRHRVKREILDTQYTITVCCLLISTSSKCCFRARNILAGAKFLSRHPAFGGKERSRNHPCPKLYPTIGGSPRFGSLHPLCDSFFLILSTNITSVKSTHNIKS